MANGTANHDRTEAESAIAERADAVLATDVRERREKVLAAQQEAERARRAAERARALLSSLRRPPTGCRSLGREVMRDSWKTRAGLTGSRSTAGSPGDAGEGAGSGRDATLMPGQQAGKSQAREMACPACGAEPGVRCGVPGGHHPSRVARLRRSLR
ncbi:zinc finger domain-containing protein [Streptomyces xanthophaeus]